jgi:hypothetical protein
MENNISHDWIVTVQPLEPYLMLNQTDNESDNENDPTQLYQTIRSS